MALSQVLAMVEAVLVYASMIWHDVMLLEKSMADKTVFPSIYTYDFMENILWPDVIGEK